jgi:hypothetical protein
MSGIEHNADWVPVKQRLCCWGVGLQHESRWVVSFVRVAVSRMLEETSVLLAKNERILEDSAFPRFHE